MNNNEMVVGVFVGLKPAFKTIDRQIIIIKLKCNGIDEHALS